MRDFEEIAQILGCSGPWLEVGKPALLDRTVRIPAGYYLICWERYAVQFEQGSQGPDSRVPPSVWWLLAAIWSPVVKWDITLAYRAGQEFPHREALLRSVGFHQHEGKFGFMELMTTPVPWEWR